MVFNRLIAFNSVRVLERAGELPPVSHHVTLAYDMDKQSFHATHPTTTEDTSTGTEKFGGESVGLIMLLPLFDCTYRPTCSFAT